MGETLLVSFRDGTKRISLAEKTGRNWLTAGKFPVPTHLIGGKRMIRVCDLEEFVAGLGPKISQPAADINESLVPAPAAETKRRRGRPRKAVSSQTKSVGGRANAQ